MITSLFINNAKLVLTYKKEVFSMLDQVSDKLFYEYFAEWIDLYKDGAVRQVTLNKYYVSLRQLKEIAPHIRLKNLGRKEYQFILNQYAKTHEKQTTTDFHYQLKGAILDAVEDGFIVKNPTRKVVIKGKPPGAKKTKYLNQFDLQKLLDQLELGQELSVDWLILLLAKTGLRFSEALALMPKDFDFSYQTISINKTWNYKEKSGGFLATKNRASNRKIPIDWKTGMQFAQLVKDLSEGELLFVKERVFNSTVNGRLKRYCVKANVPVITVHGLRHTHASLLLFAGVSVASVAKRLGHANMTTTQQVYLHIIQELENQDNDKIMRYLSSL